MKQNFTVRQGALDGVEALLSVAQHRSFRRAAAELGVTPSAISQAVRAVEARVGAALFIRTTRSVGLTEAPNIYVGGDGPSVSRICVSMPAYAFAARTGRSHPGPLSAATSRSRRSSQDR